MSDECKASSVATVTVAWKESTLLFDPLHLLAQLLLAEDGVSLQAVGRDNRENRTALKACVRQALVLRPELAVVGYKPEAHSLPVALRGAVLAFVSARGEATARGLAEATAQFGHKTNQRKIDGCVKKHMKSVVREFEQRYCLPNDVRDGLREYINSTLDVVLDALQVRTMAHWTSGLRHKYGKWACEGAEDVLRGLSDAVLFLCHTGALSGKEGEALFSAARRAAFVLLTMVVKPPGTLLPAFKAALWNTAEYTASLLGLEHVALQEHVHADTRMSAVQKTMGVVMRDYGCPKAKDEVNLEGLRPLFKALHGWEDEAKADEDIFSPSELVAPHAERSDSIGFVARVHGVAGSAYRWVYVPADVWADVLRATDRLLPAQELVDNVVPHLFAYRAQVPHVTIPLLRGEDGERAQHVAIGSAVEVTLSPSELARVNLFRPRGVFNMDMLVRKATSLSVPAKIQVVAGEESVNGLLARSTQPHAVAYVLGSAALHKAARVLVTMCEERDRARLCDAILPEPARVYKSL